MSSYAESNSAAPLLEECFRWYGPKDPVSLADIRQCGATGVYTALHEFAYGEVWPREAIRERRRQIEAAGLRWAAVEAIDISEEMKTRTGRYEEHIEHYCTTLRNLAAEGIDLVLASFMPVFQWVRTDLARRLPDGKLCLSFDPVEFAAFEIHVLGRSGAEAEYRPEQLERADRFYHSLDDEQRTSFATRICGMLPGFSRPMTVDEVRARIDRYGGMDAATLRANLAAFLREIAPVARETGVRIAMHPDDPPRPLFGLPRVLSTEADFVEYLAMTDAREIGICLCTGSFGVRADNDLPGMMGRLGPRVHALHLRSVRREGDGAFYESDHLGGDVDLPAVVSAALAEQERRRREGRVDHRLSFRPDHGHLMLDDQRKPAFRNPGYSALGRMRGLAEIRGVQHALALRER